MTEKLKIGVVISSTREGRIGERVTAFVKNAILKDQEVVVFALDAIVLVCAEYNWCLPPAHGQHSPTHCGMEAMWICYLCHRTNGRVKSRGAASDIYGRYGHDGCTNLYNYYTSPRNTR
ncbi:uncharacterized protein LOC128206125 [Mya arenaria]|uniref:uncharacterized protein LOC128206125 n=1 Tax=Mya arenaria TaxID=6604 RepID=UPI0022E79B84|nr:uncharacterized protein LOC128206125 [Mya arenaria]